MENQNILVTGVPRSGTTFLGRVIALSPQTNYLWEPLNSRFRMGMEYHYPYLGSSSSLKKKQVCNDIIRNTVDYKNLKANYGRYKKDPGGLWMLFKINLGWKIAALKHRLYKPQVSVIKDPIALFLSRYLMEEFDFKIIVVLRHPAAVYLSRRGLGWEHDFDLWRSQDDFYSEHYRDYEGVLEGFSKDLIANSSLHWLVCYGYVRRLLDLSLENLLIVRHEDLCRQPEEELKRVFSFLSLDFTPKISRGLTQLTGGSKVERVSRDLSRVERRDANRLSDKWKMGITQEDLERIKGITGEIASFFYPEKEFWTL